MLYILLIFNDIVCFVKNPVAESKARQAEDTDHLFTEEDLKGPAPSRSKRTKKKARRLIEAGTPIDEIVKL